MLYQKISEDSKDKVSIFPLSAVTGKDKENKNYQKKFEI